MTHKEQIIRMGRKSVNMMCMYRKIKYLNYKEIERFIQEIYPQIEKKIIQIFAQLWFLRKPLSSLALTHRLGLGPADFSQHSFHCRVRSVKSLDDL